MRWLADENFPYAIVRGLRRRNPAFDIIRTQDAGLVGSEDPVLLAWAAEQGRMILTHDIRTMPAYAYARIRQGLPMPGVVQVSRALTLRPIIEQILLMDECGEPGEWEGQVVYLPLR